MSLLYVRRMKNAMIIYQGKSGAIELKGDFKKETLWASQAQIADAFDVDVRTVNEHISNIYKSAELKERTTIRKFRIVQKEGARTINRDINHYNLDLVLSVGYRINSKRATLFRQWATKTLRAHIVDGYTINRSRIAKNYDTFLQAVSQVKALLPHGSAMDAAGALELAKLFAETWVSLDAYDKGSFPLTGVTRKRIDLTAEELTEALKALKQELIAKNETTGLFGVQRQKDAVTGIVGNVFQTFDGKDLYPGVEEKAAHLLYFMVKNHPFTDGNKRSGAFAFVWFLKKARRLDIARLTPEALTALTLLIAESNAKDKARMTGLVAMLLRG